MLHSRILTAFLFLLTRRVAADNSIAFSHPLRPVPEPLGCSDDGMGCPSCEADERNCKSRVRRSWSRLGNVEKQRFFDAINVMKSTPKSEGRELYGFDFTPYDELILQHAAAANDPRGDQGHLGQHFSLFHRLFLLKFENSLLAIDPQIEGLPYWDMREGPDVVFGPSPISFGSSTGQGSNYEVTDGAFANWDVAPLDSQLLQSRSLYEGFDDIFSNYTGTTLLRTTNVPTTSLVRYPVCDGGNDVGPLTYSQADYETCANQTTFGDFHWCLESESTNGVHSMAHFWIGSADSNEYGFGCPSFSPPNLTESGARQGDYIDKSTSPNDPIFWLHHSFVDMLTMSFMRRNEAGDRFWSFKASDENGTTPHVEGTFLRDVVSSAWPFEGSETLNDPEAGSPPQGPLKYWEVMCWVGPTTAIYTYDVFGDESCEAIVMEEEEDGAQDSGNPYLLHSVHPLLGFLLFEVLAAFY
ncbi:tyrosinase [Seminavis robusta]|uniref:Tyrosinase n=1 Tax=Seminavis robusta TaxID=568900 RepID=A0A9N8H6I8_9STRA|nr:tyrosinase [Seminavis robusta]|eukprot:Sro101_g051650.1 tyrosinase (469) ;mRNA; f:65032-66438